jgi:hypothetical protein
MKSMLIVLALSLAATAALPEFNMLVGVEHGPDRPQNGLYLYSTLTNTKTKIYPAANVTAQWGDAVKGAFFSPNASQVAFTTNMQTLTIMNRDGSNPRVADLGGRTFRGGENFAWTSNGIFWYDQTTKELLRYVPETGAVTAITTITYPPGTNFGGIFASTDGTRMWSWLETANKAENTATGVGLPFIYFNNGDFTTPNIRYATCWGHGNMMLPDGSKTLHVGWNFSTNPITHPYIWIWDLNTFTAYDTLLHELNKDFQSRALVQVANSSEWIGMICSDETNYLWNWSTAGATPQQVGLNEEYYYPSHIWMGALPAIVTTWQVTETQIALSSTAATGTIHITNWTAGSSPTAQSSKTWAASPVITRNSTNVTIAYTITAPPAVKDTTVISMSDGTLIKTCRLIWTPTQRPADRLVLTGTATDTSVVITWTNTIGAQYSFRVQKSSGSAWGAMQTATTSYTDRAPAEGANLYRVAAISGTDTSYQQITVNYVAPASITITSPNSGQRFALGQHITVTWTAVKVTSVQIELSTDDGESFRLLNSTGAINAGTAQWSNFPVTLPDTAFSSIVIRIHPYQQSTPMNMVTISTSSSSAVLNAAMIHGLNSTAKSQCYDLHGRRLSAAPRVSSVLFTSVTGRNVKATTVIR